MPNNTPRPLVDPAEWAPQKWEDVAGNRDIVDHFRTMVRNVRFQGARSGYRTLITGESRSGKSSITLLAIRCLYCQELDPATLNPCPGSCHSCRQRPEAYGLYGFQNHTSVFDLAGGTTPIEFHFIPVDCASPDLTDKSLKSNIIDHTKMIGDRVLRVVHLDEVHELANKKLDAPLLIPLDRHKAIWIATTAYAKKERLEGRSKKLDEMFIKRFNKQLTTRTPSVDELAAFLFQRCIEYGFKVEAPARDNLEHWARDSRQMPYHAMELLAEVWKNSPPDRIIKGDFIKSFRYSFQE